MKKPQALDQAIGDAFKHLRDVSVRDGIQSWDANKWKIDDILPVIQDINGLATTLKSNCGVELPPVEAWGGGQVAQPAKFLGEDPFVNLAQLHKAAPDLRLQCLYRGRQGFGFAPISSEVQHAAIEAAADAGIKVFRIFDMMNDLENMQTSFTAVKDYKKAHPENKVVLEGAVAYISEPEIAGKGRAWTLDEYAQIGVTLAKQGCDEIAIKNFSGTGDLEMKDLVSTMRHALDAAGFKNIALNLHTHGQKPDILKSCIDAGADKIDVAIGELSEGPSHTNMRSMVHTILKDKGFQASDIDAHPVMQQLAKVESKISAVAHRKEADGKSFDDKRASLKTLVQDTDKLETYRMAAGALSDLTGRILSGYNNKVMEWKAKGIENIPSQDALIARALEIGAELREKAGRFNTVTPGAKILVDQIVPLALNEVIGKPRDMTQYQDALIDVAIGRFGRNQGMEKGIGDQKWRDALLMFRSLKALDVGVKSNKISRAQQNLVISGIASGANSPQIPVRNGQIRLNAPELESILMETDINKFRAAIEAAIPKAEGSAAILNELRVGRSPEPTAGLAEGKNILNSLHAIPVHATTNNAGLLDKTYSGNSLQRGTLDMYELEKHSGIKTDTLPLLAILLRDPANTKPHAAIEKVISTVLSQPITFQSAEKRDLAATREGEASIARR